jgi:hypothetical protein
MYLIHYSIIYDWIFINTEREDKVPFVNLLLLTGTQYLISFFYGFTILQKY